MKSLLLVQGQWYGARYNLRYNFLIDDQYEFVASFYESVSRFNRKNEVQ